MLGPTSPLLALPSSLQHLDPKTTLASTSKLPSLFTFEHQGLTMALCWASCNGPIPILLRYSIKGYDS